jgi:hypothetical protein
MLLHAYIALPLVGACLLHSVLQRCRPKVYVLCLCTHPYGRERLT